MTIDDVITLSAAGNIHIENLIKQTIQAEKFDVVLQVVEMLDFMMKECHRKKDYGKIEGIQAVARNLHQMADDLLVEAKMLGIE